MKKKDADNYGPYAAIVREVITKRQGRIQLDHVQGRTVFEYDDSSERRDQLANAFNLAKQLVDKGEAKSIIDEVTDPALPRRVTVYGGRPQPISYKGV